MSLLPLSNSTIKSKIDEMSTNVEIQLVNLLKSTEFGIQIDESTLQNNEALLLVYVRYVSQMKSKKIYCLESTCH